MLRNIAVGIGVAKESAVYGLHWCPSAVIACVLFMMGRMLHHAGASLANTLLPMLCSWESDADIPLAFRGPVAQLGARLNGIEEVGGSNPPRSTRIHC